MTRFKKYFAAPACAALSMLAIPAMAQDVKPASYLDLFYVAKADLEVDDFQFDKGDGFGAKGRFTILDTAFLSAEYQNNEYDPFERQNNSGILGGPTTTRFEVEVETIRAGAGLYFAETPFFVMGEYIDYEAELSTTGNEADEDTVGDDVDDDGYGVHGGIDGKFGEALGLQAQIGYVDIGSVGNGMEFLVGASFSFSPGFGVFADYRRSELKDDIKTTPEDLRVGLRLAFR